MDFIYPQWPAPKNVRALSTNRIGGVGKPPFDSFNLAMHVDDENENVIANREILSKQAGLPSQPNWLNQTHSTDVIEIESSKKSSDALAKGVLIDADGSITSQTHAVCGVLTADCMPVLFTNKTGTRVAAIHAGWRGLANGILEKAVSEMNCPPEQIIAWVGPCIGPTAFEVGMEVRDQLGGPNTAYTASENSSADSKKVYADLVQLAQIRLQQVGVVAFSASGECTYNNKTNFFSYRRTGQCGRMATLIWMESL